MKNIEDVLFLIQARVCSQRVPRKMVAPFGDTTLIDLALNKVKSSQIIPMENFFLSVGEKDLIDVGHKHSVNIFQRSPRSVGSEGERLIELYEWWDQLSFRYAVLINPCAPFLTISSIDSFIRYYLETEATGLFGVVAKKNYFWNERMGSVTDWPKDLQAMNTKSVGITYEAAHCLYAGKLSDIGKNIWMGTFRNQRDPELYRVNEQEALDIDYPWQFELCEALYRAKTLQPA